MYSEKELVSLKKANENNLKFIRTLARTMGLWPTDTNIKFINMYFIIVCMYGQVAYFVLNINQLYNITEVLCSLITIILTTFKVLRFYFLRDTLCTVLEELIEHKMLQKLKFMQNSSLRNNIKIIMDKSWKEANLLTKIFLLSGAPIAFLYAAVPFVTNIQNSWTFSENSTVKFPYKTAFPKMDSIMNTSPFFEALFLTETASGYSTLVGFNLFDGFYVFMTLYAKGMLQVLNMMLLNSTNPHISEQQRPAYIRECVLHHARVIRFCEKINQVYGGVNLLQLFASTLIICLVAFQASNNEQKQMSNTILMIIYFITGVYQLAIYCFYGQTIIDESSKISTSCYSCNWIECSGQFKRLIRMIITNSQKPIVIKAWNVSVMSVETFSAILRSAASYYTALQTLMEP